MEIFWPVVGSDKYDDMVLLACRMSLIMHMQTSPVSASGTILNENKTEPS